MLSCTTKHPMLFSWLGEGENGEEGDGGEGGVVGLEGLRDVRRGG